MIEKVKKILTAILAGIVAISILYAAIGLIKSAFTKPDLLTGGEVELYKTEQNLVTNYTTYFFIEDCFENLIESVKQGKIDELYDFYIKDYKKAHDKDEVYAKLKKFGVSTNQIKTKEIYQADDLYVVTYEMNGANETILITLNAKSTNYEFAIVD